MISDSMGGAMVGGSAMGGGSVMVGICEWGGTYIVRGGVTDGTGTALVDGGIHVEAAG